MEILAPLKWLGLFLVSLIWIYMAARMVGRAFSRTIEELWGIPTNFKKERTNGKKEKQTKTEKTDERRDS